MTYVSYGSVTAIGVLFPALTIICLAIRFWVWRRHASGTFIDDYFILPAAVFVIGAGISLAVGGFHDRERIGYAFLIDLRSTIGIRRGPYSLQGEVFHNVREHQVQMEQLEYGFWPINNLSICFTKLSILFFYRRLFQGRSRRTLFDVCNWTLIGLTICWTIAFVFAELFACGKHVDYAWGTLYKLRYECIDTFQMFAVSSSINFIIDLAILIEPIAIIFTLQMVTSQKLQASAIFLLGLFAIGAGLTEMVIRIIVYDFDLTQPTKKLLGIHGYDDMGKSCAVSILLFWSYMEMAVGFVVACLLPCRKFFDHVGEQIKSGSLVTLVSRRNSSKSTASGETRKSSETHPSYQEKKQHVEPVDLEIGRIMTSK